MIEIMDKPVTSHWKDETLELLKHRSVSITYKMIADATGVTPRWIEMFAAGKYDNPGICYVNAIRNYLKERAVELSTHS